MYVEFFYKHNRGIPYLATFSDIGVSFMVFHNIYRELSPLDIYNSASLPILAVSFKAISDQIGSYHIDRHHFLENFWLQDIIRNNLNYVYEIISTTTTGGGDGGGEPPDFPPINFPPIPEVFCGSITILTNLQCTYTSLCTTIDFFYGCNLNVEDEGSYHSITISYSTNNPFITTINITLTGSTSSTVETVYQSSLNTEQYGYNGNITLSSDVLYEEYVLNVTFNVGSDIIDTCQSTVEVSSSFLRIVFLGFDDDSSLTGRYAVESSSDLGTVQVELRNADINGNAVIQTFNVNLSQVGSDFIGYFQVVLPPAGSCLYYYDDNMQYCTNINSPFTLSIPSYSVSLNATQNTINAAYYYPNPNSYVIHGEITGLQENDYINYVYRIRYHVDYPADSFTIEATDRLQYYNLVQVPILHTHNGNTLTNTVTIFFSIYSLNYRLILSPPTISYGTDIIILRKLYDGDPQSADMSFIVSDNDISSTNLLSFNLKWYYSNSSYTNSISSGSNTLTINSQAPVVCNTMYPQDTIFYPYLSISTNRASYNHFFVENVYYSFYTRFISDVPLFLMAMVKECNNDGVSYKYYVWFGGLYYSPINYENTYVYAIYNGKTIFPDYVFHFESNNEQLFFDENFMFFIFYDTTNGILQSWCFVRIPDEFVNDKQQLINYLKQFNKNHTKFFIGSYNDELSYYDKITPIFIDFDDLISMLPIIEDYSDPYAFFLNSRKDYFTSPCDYASLPFYTWFSHDPYNYTYNTIYYFTLSLYGTTDFNLGETDCSNVTYNAYYTSINSTDLSQYFDFDLRNVYLDSTSLYNFFAFSNLSDNFPSHMVDHGYILRFWNLNASDSLSQNRNRILGYINAYYGTITHYLFTNLAYSSGYSVINILHSTPDLSSVVWPDL